MRCNFCQHFVAFFNIWLGIHTLFGAMTKYHNLGFDLTRWGWVMHICVGKLTILGSDNGLSSGRRQAIIWTNAAILLIGPLGTNFSEILIEIQTFSFTGMLLKMSSAKWRPFCLGLNELRFDFCPSCSSNGKLYHIHGEFQALEFSKRTVEL